MEKNKTSWELGAPLGFSGNIDETRRKLDYVVKLGYSSIFAGLFNEKEKRLATDEELKEFSEILKDYPVKPYTTHAIWLVSEPDKPAGEILPFQESIIKKASILGVKCLTYHFGHCKGLQEGEDFNLDKALKRYNVSIGTFRENNIHNLKEICRRAQVYGLSVTIENLPVGCLADFDTDVSNLLEIIKEVDEPNLGICFDSGHAFISGVNLHQEILKAGRYLLETHFHDNIGMISDRNIINDLHQPVGIGRINWLEVIAGLKKINFINPVIFEIGCEENTLRINRSNWERFSKLYEEKFTGWNFSEKD